MGASCQYREIVFARTTPEQKLRIVKEFQKRECIVGMTVTVSTTRQVSRQPMSVLPWAVAAMSPWRPLTWFSSTRRCPTELRGTLLTDRFSSIVVAVEYGRLVLRQSEKGRYYSAYGARAR